MTARLGGKRVPCSPSPMGLPLSGLSRAPTCPSVSLPLGKHMARPVTASPQATALLLPHAPREGQRGTHPGDTQQRGGDCGCEETEPVARAPAHSRRSLFHVQFRVPCAHANPSSVLTFP